VTASRLGAGLTGNVTTVISTEDIERSPGRTITEILSLEAGVRFQDLYGGTNGAGQTIDVRGFGEPATVNTLILINGRRLSDMDLASVDFFFYSPGQHRTHRNSARQSVQDAEDMKAEW